MKTTKTFADFTTTKDEFTALVSIAERAEKLTRNYQNTLPALTTLLMDLECAHAQFDLDLPAMLAGSATDLLHDVFGIVRHIDRTTLTVGGCFLPRFAR